MEAGNVASTNVSPRNNRRIVDIISDVNICYSEHARRYLNASVWLRSAPTSADPHGEVLHNNLPKSKLPTS